MMQPPSLLTSPLARTKSGTFPAQSKPVVRFAAGEQPPAPKKLAPQLGKALKYFDFRDVGLSHVAQIQLVYAACILWRLVAANQRRKASPTQSWNEIRESLLRDSVGYAFWFFGTPTLQRLYLKMIPKDYQKALIHTNQQHQPGPWQKIKQWNPISRYAVPTSEQVKDMKAQALARIEDAGIKKSDEAFLKVEDYYKKLMTHRNVATGIGLLSTIGLLGIGINYLNFYLTNRNVKQREMELLKPPFPEPPRLPKFQPTPSLSAPAFNQRPPQFSSGNGGLPFSPPLLPKPVG
ncbi:hypothetical protein [Vampirovibrio sp.]|uniref:hypothetical protein n=1 Tax=Vampirovibrio sp. TaxID=2717857 RepID=UPI0035948606